MNSMKKFAGRLIRNEEGASLVEYGLLVGFIAVVCIVAVTALGTNISAMFTNVAGQLGN